MAIVNVSDFPTFYRIYRIIRDMLDVVRNSLKRIETIDKSNPPELQSTDSTSPIQRELDLRGGP